MSDPVQYAYRSGPLTLCYWQWGADEKPPLLLIHGGRDQSRSFDDLAARFAADYRVIAPDLRGHGDSDWSNEAHYTLTDFVADLILLVDQIEGGPIDVIGHSLGGNLALRIAAIVPERIRRLVAIESLELPLTRNSSVDGIPLADRWRAWLTERRSDPARVRRVYPTLAAAVERIAREFPQLDRQLVNHLAAHSTRSVSDGLVWKYDDRTRTRPPEDVAGGEFDQLLAAIHCPTLFFYGDASWIPLPSPTRLALLADHRLVQLPGAGHWLHHERLDQVAADIASFFRDNPHHD